MLEKAPTPNDAARIQLERLYEIAERNRLALISSAHSQDEQKVRIARAQHNAWLEAKSITEEAAYLFRALGGC